MRIALSSLCRLHEADCIVTRYNRNWSDWCCHTLISFL